MSDQQQLDILIKTLYNSEGFQNLEKDQQQLKDRGKELEGELAKQKHTTEGTAGAFGQLKEELTHTVAGYFALEKAAEFMKDSFMAAVNDEKAHRGLQNAIMATTAATREQAKAASEYIKELEHESSIPDEQLIPAFKKLVVATGDVEQAKKLLRIAVDAENAGFTDAQTAAEQMVRYMTTGAVRGTDEFAVALKRAGAEGGDVTKTLTRLGEKFHEQAEANDTQDKQLRELKISWEDAKKAIGGMVTDIMPALKVGAQGVVMAFSGVIAIVQTIGLAVATLAQKVGAAVSFIDGALHGSIKGAWTAYKEQIQEINEDASAQFDEIIEKANAAQEAFEHTKRAAADAGGALGPIKKGGGKTPEEEAADRAKAAAEAHKKAIDQINQQYDDMLKRAKLATDDEVKYAREEARILTEKASRFKEGTRERLNAEVAAKAARDRLRAAETAAEKKRTDDAAAAAKREVQAREDAWRREDALFDLRMGREAKTLADEKRFLAEREAMLKARLAAVKGDVDAEIKLNQQLLQNEQRMAAAEKRISQARIAQKKKEVAQTHDAAMAGIESSKALFGENKSIQLAEAIVNGVSAAIESFDNGGGYPAGLVPMALSIATSAAQIAKIEGAGFDDPANDALLGTFGKRWAKDMGSIIFGNLAEGFGGELRNQTQQATTVIQQQISNPGSTHYSSTVNVGAMPLIDTASEPMLKALQVRLDEMKRLNDQGINK